MLNCTISLVREMGKNSFKTKINNSYESEPSSGSGSLLEELNEYAASEDDIMNLPCLLKPPVIPFELSQHPQPIKTAENSSAQSAFHCDIAQTAIGTKTKFEFREKQKLNIVEYCNAANEENSSNAVDINLISDSCQLQPEQNHVKSEQITSQQSATLTFNGKIERFSEEPYQTSSTTIAMKNKNENSPDLFADDDEESLEGEDNDPGKRTNTSADCGSESNFEETYHLNETESLCTETNNFRSNTQRDWELLRRIKTCLAGVPPPPALTIPQIDILNAVISNKESILNYNCSLKIIESSMERNKPWFFKPTHTIEEIKSTPWREILGARQHGISFNTSKASESNEMLSLAVIERFIGAETATSYQNSPSSAKKRNIRLKKLTQSPGNRLSHLAKRRAVFSSANLATTSQKTASTSVSGLQILLDKNKPKNRRKNTPKRITPSSKKKKSRKTPTSSAKKGLLRCDMARTGPSRENSKRALFQSPAKQIQLKVNTTKKPPVIKPEIANRVEKSKRALFSPAKSNQIGDLLFDSIEPFGIKRKRNRLDGDDDKDDDMELTRNSKIFRGNGENLTPRALKIKSQSFCVGASSSSVGLGKSATENGNNHIFNKSLSKEGNGKLLMKASSDTTIASSQLSENHRKKLLWAVSQALQLKLISVKHENFKQYAAVLARVVKRLFQEYFQKSNTSTSETMLKLAKKHVHCVMAGKSADDIYLSAKFNIETDLKRTSSLRFSGYIGPDEYEKRKNSLIRNNSNLHCSMSSILTYENSSDSFNISQNSSSVALSQQSSSTTTSEFHFIDRMSVDVFQKLQCTTNKCDNVVDTKIKLPIQSNPNLQNSSSKSNLCDLALRENVDCELRRSTQKNFTGKDQRNVSPYVQAAATTTTTTTTATTVGQQSQRQNSALKHSNAIEYKRNPAKAKRQISFDS